jgi:hypothetical protein
MDSLSDPALLAFETAQLYPELHYSQCVYFFAAFKAILVIKQL